MEMLTQRWEKVACSLNEVVTARTSPCSLRQHRTYKTLCRNGQISMQTHTHLHSAAAASGTADATKLGRTGRWFPGKAKIYLMKCSTSTKPSVDPFCVLAAARSGHAHTPKGAAAPNGHHRWDAADSSSREGLTRMKSSDAIIPPQV